MSAFCLCPLPPEPRPSAPVDDLLLHRVRTTIAAHLEDPAFSVGKLAALVGLSRSQLFRRLKQAEATSVSGFIRRERLRAAAQLLASGKASVSDAAFAVGFNSLPYFSRCFRKQFGTLPSQFKMA